MSLNFMNIIMSSFMYQFYITDKHLISYAPSLRVVAYTHRFEECHLPTQSK